MSRTRGAATPTVIFRRPAIAQDRAAQGVDRSAAGRFGNGIMRFSELLKASGISHRRTGQDANVTGVVDDSRRVKQGSCFVAVRGPQADGHRYIAAAAAGGAAAIICEDPAAAGDLPTAVVTDTRQAAGPVAQAMLGWPARKLAAVGVTGTNGKTTVALLTQAIVQAAGRRCGVVGTIHHDTGGQTVAARNTTPGAIELADLTAEMVEAGCSHVVMEVSSHALDQHRAAGIDFQVGIFTNLSGDHLDYHKTMEAYLAAKARLFEPLGSAATAVLNRDDPAGEKIAERTAAHVLWYGLGSEADLRGAVERMDVSGAVFSMSCGRETVTVHTPLIGRHNVLNCLAAAGAARALGVDLAGAAEALAGVECVPGRLERVKAEAPYRVFVDYAHTDDALANVLETVAPMCIGGKLILVFGCGGDRDRTKRPRMAAVAQKHAHRIVLTSDNPRSEDPQGILDEIVAGLSAAGRAKTHVQLDRRLAIEEAVASAESGDVVLIAGKGHENYQIIGDRRVRFDDVETASQAIAARRGSR